jgi:hypothetical protein
MKIVSPKKMGIETSSMCNRTCPTCIRNSHPDRSVVGHWFKQNYMPMEIIKQILDQVQVDFKSIWRVYLSQFNEPLMDSRIIEIIKLVRTYDRPFPYLITNGDFLTEELAKDLDDLLEGMVISLYEFDPVLRSIKREKFRSWFKKTKLLIKGSHSITHFCNESPKLAEQFKDGTCTYFPRRIIINNRGQYLLCCEDIAGSFDLGTFPEVSLKDYWYGEKRNKIIKDLSTPGGRNNYEYCRICPR